MPIQTDRAAWLKGPAAERSTRTQPEPHPFRLVLLGAPGIGKGTQAALLSERLGACHLSTGDVFRMAKSLPENERSPAMTAALGYMKRGELVPDATVLEMVRERVNCLRCSRGFLLDGFPRTVTQAEALEGLLRHERLALDAAVSYELPIEEVVARLSGRRTCSGCKAVFHVTTLPPRQAGVCDHCAGNLIQRDDDRPESVRVRMQAYATSTAPLSAFYRQRGLLLTVAATGTPDEILRRTLKVLDVAS